jgi:hypothetical protein
MKNHTKLLFGGIALLIVPVLVLTICIMYQLSQMNPPDAGQLNLRWGFLAFYSMAAGLTLLIFSHGIRQREKRIEQKQKFYKTAKEQETQKN